MSNDSNRFSEDDLLKKGFVKDGAGCFVPAPKKSIYKTLLEDKTLNLSERERRDLQFTEDTGMILVDSSIKTPMLNKALKQVEQKEKFNPKTALFAKGRLKKGVMNKTEATYARHLEALLFNSDIAWFGFERLTIKLANDTRLTPDFAIMYNSGEMHFHDVKGSKFIFQDDAKVKMKVAAETIPFRFFVVYPRTQKNGGGWDLHEINKDK